MRHSIKLTLVGATVVPVAAAAAAAAFRFFSSSVSVKAAFCDFTKAPKVSEGFNCRAILYCCVVETLGETKLVVSGAGVEVVASPEVGALGLLDKVFGDTKAVAFGVLEVVVVGL